VYNQHRRWLYDHDDDRCPRAAFIDDLTAAASSWLESGDQLLIAIDANDDVRNCDLTRRFRELGLHEAVMARHGLQAPPTYNRGSLPIDAIYVSSTMLNLPCGYLAFGDAVPSDHRALWMDIPFPVAFGHSLPPVVRPKARRLKCTDPRIVDRYLSSFEAFLLKHHLPERAFDLQQRCTYPISVADAVEWERIDRLRVAGMKMAEKNCRRLQMGGVPWSPRVQECLQVIQVWHLIVKRRLGLPVSGSLLRRKITQTHLTSALDAPLDVAKARLSDAYREYKKVKKDADNLRITWMESLSMALASQGNVSQATHLSLLLQRESQRRHAAQIRRIGGVARSGGVTSVVAPDDDGVWTEVNSKEAMEAACLRENESRFRQAASTPFLQPPLSEALGPLGIGPTCDAVLRGSFVPPAETDPYAAVFIRHLRMNAAVLRHPPISTIIETETHVAGWRKAKERTSSGPSGLHFGHFKAGTRNTLISSFEATMANVPFATGYSPERWRHGTDVELLKKPGNFRVDSLRTILLYEADFNQNNKLLGRRMMAHAERLGLLAPEQYGSRHSLSAIAHAVNKRLTFDLISQKKRPCILCSNDAKSCYDRIVHSAATLCMRRVGMPEAPVVSMFTTIQNMRHYVRTIYGDSTTYFGGSDWVTPVHGVGQGNGAGPAIWAVVSTPVLEMMRAEGHGAFFRSAISGEEIRFVGYAFVDDTDLCQTGNTGTESATEVLARAQAALDCWEGGLRTTGGAIVPAKSHWALIDFVWNRGDWRHASIAESPGNLTVLDHSGLRLQLERISVDDGRRTLGVRLAADGNMRDEYKYLREVSQTWQEKIRSGHLPRHLAWQALTTVILPKLTYPLPATTFTRKECHQIFSPALRACLAASGIPRSFPTAMVHAPLSRQGLALPHLYTEQGIAHILMILRHGHLPSDFTGQLLRAGLDELRLQLGLPGGVFAHNYRQFHSLVARDWLSHTWQFLWEHDLRIDDPGPHLSLRCRGDRFLIAAFSNGGFSGNDLRRLNQCRLFLRVSTLADICQGCGTRISTWAWNGESPSSTTYRVNHEWPAQGPPSPTDWDDWRRALCLVFGVDSRTRVLRAALGPWFSHSTPALWQWYFSPSDERLYQHVVDGTWRFYPKLPGRPSRRGLATKYSAGGHHVADLSSLPCILSPATVDPHGAFLLYTGSRPVDSMGNDRRLPEASIERRIRNLPQATRWAVVDCSCSPSSAPVALASAIADSTCFAVSDGSFKAGFGTSAWILGGHNIPDEIIGKNIVPGHSEDQSSFRSELSGLFGIASMVAVLCEQYDIQSGGVEVGCDGKEALRRCFEDDFSPSPSDAHFDLIVATRTMLSRSPIRWQFRHVKGHQDELAGGGELDPWALLNIRMDLLAKTYWAETHAQHLPTQWCISGEPWPLWLAGRKVCQRIKATIVDHIHGTEGSMYWVTRARIAREAISEVDWGACGRALGSASLSRRTWVSKHATGFCGVGKMMFRWGKWPSAACPRCEDPVETASHVWSCSGHRANEVWNASIARLRRWLVSVKTQPGIRDALCSHLSAWRSGLLSLPTRSHFPGVRSAISSQIRIGWQPFLEGLVSVEWAAVQQRYYEWLGSRRHGRRWVTQLIAKLWDVAWDLWEHRNGIVHSGANDTLHLLSRVRDAVRREYQLGSATLMTTDKALFSTSRSDLFRAPLSVQEAWLASVQSARQRAMRRDQASFRGERQFMRTWLASATGAVG
jgi:hypothetical protein